MNADISETIKDGEMGSQT